ncbi:hypothetical protein ACOZ4L_07490 [Haloplanus ruber]|uniref:C2H2-type domain-containing protein n=1 Tax=Haloplanus ruber TaxID=869892 RepID=A0ABD6CUT0_9EURY|nr:hypothetical protein [Haloplanus ruber]
MNGHWYCTDCEERIDKDSIDDHEARGHHVKGHFRPDRLLPGDPELLGAEVGRGDGGGR